MNICVVGCGYVGLVTASAFADFGNEVVALDVDKKKMNKFRSKIYSYIKKFTEEM